MVDELSERAKQVREKQVEPEEDKMLKIVNDGRKLALDQRLMNPELPDAPNSKVNICVQNVYDDIKEKLIAAGVKPEEIAFIQNLFYSKEGRLPRGT